MKTTSAVAHEAGFTPVEFMLPCSGTNGYISQWGAMLSGVPPVVAASSDQAVA